METIIITECKNPYGKYWLFREKKSGQILAEIDKKNEREYGPGKLYFVYTLRGGFLYETARRSNKDLAFKFVKRHILLQIRDVEFKWDLMCETYSY
jgi:hypothetical protein